jgi:CRP-like cAMP-binding protein
MIAIMFDGLAIKGRLARFRADEAIFRRGDPAVAVYHVLAGRIAMVRTLEHGEVAIIARVGPGASFAEAATFSDVYHCDAVALSDCELRVYPSALLRDLLARDHAAAISVASYLADQVRGLRTRVELLRIKRADDRVLAWLRLQARGAPPRVERTGPWSDVAVELGLTPEAFYRAVGSLARGGRIRRTGRALELVAPRP